MRNIPFWSGFGFALFTILALISILISVVTYTYHGGVEAGFFGFLVVHHLAIMLITIFLCIGYGFTWAYFLQQRIIKEQKTSQNILDIVLAFLNKEESAVLKHLVAQEGESSQAKIAHIHDMGAVKALRTVQKMQDKNLISVEKHGKVRTVILKDEIFELLNK